MTRIEIVLADEQLEAVLAAWRVTDPASRERLMIFGALGLVTLLIVLWAVFVRKKRRRRRKHHHPGHHSAVSTSALEPLPLAEAPAAADTRRRSRRSRRRHRVRNPTLAETGGLPPVRSAEPPGPIA
jgi:type II secretory pathway component PulM